MENKDYDYRTKPYSQAKIFDIHSLSQDGFSQYISPKSHIHNYLDKLSQNNFKSFYLGGDNSYRRSFSSSLLMGNPPEENKEDNNEYNNNENQEEAEIDQARIEEGNKIEEEEKTKMDFGYKTANEFFPKNIIEKSENKRIPKQIMNLNENMNKTSGNFYVKSNINLLSRRLDFTSSNFKGTINPVNINRFDKSYASNLNVLSSKDFFKNKNKTEHKYNRKYEGFQSYNVPRVEKNNIDFKKPMNKLAQNIGKSCTGMKRLSSENPFSKEKLSEVKQENLKLYTILKNQTNKKFLKFANLPNISKVMDLPKLKMKKNPEVEKVKHMGERYNPYNFQAGRDCETNRRNHVGGLFNH